MNVVYELRMLRNCRQLLNQRIEQFAWNVMFSRVQRERPQLYEFLEGKRKTSASPLQKLLPDLRSKLAVSHNSTLQKLNSQMLPHGHRANKIAAEKVTIDKNQRTV